MTVTILRNAQKLITIPIRSEFEFALCVFRCTSDDWLSYPNYQVAIPLYCRGVTSRNEAILAMPPSIYEQEKPVGCKLINSRVSVPLQLEDSQFWSPMEGLVLTWSEPSCRICENQGKLCAFKSDTGSDIACSNPPPSKGMLFNIFSLTCISLRSIGMIRIIISKL